MTAIEFREPALPGAGGGDLSVGSSVRLGRSDRPQAAAVSQGVGHVQVVGPGLGPVFPGMGAGVGADKPLLPVGGRSLLVMALEGLGVVFPLVAETLAEIAPGGAVLDQPVPVIMSDLMAKMPQQRAVRLVQVEPPCARAPRHRPRPH